MNDKQPTDAELYAAFVQPGTAREVIAAMGVESAERMVAYRRRSKVSPEMRDLPLSDEAIAAAIVRHALVPQGEEPPAGQEPPPPEPGTPEKSYARALWAALLVAGLSMGCALSCWMSAGISHGSGADLWFLTGRYLFWLGFVFVAAVGAVVALALGLMLMRAGIAGRRLVVLRSTAGAAAALALLLPWTLRTEPITGIQVRAQYLVGRRDLANLYLSRLNLAGADLSGADLRGTSLAEANLSGADLRGADLRGAYLEGPELKQTVIDAGTQMDARQRWAWMIFNEGGANRDLRGADLSRLDLSGVDLSGANLAGAKLFEAELVEANLAGADLTAVDLRRADVRFADLHGATLVRATLLQANLSGADLRNADLTGALMIKTALAGTDLSGATMPDGRKHE